MLGHEQLDFFPTRMQEAGAGAWVSTPHSLLPTLIYSLLSSPLSLSLSFCVWLLGNTLKCNFQSIAFISGLRFFLGYSHPALDAARPL